MNMNHDARTENELKGSEEHKVIPIRRVPFTDHSQLPSDFSATPGGTLFSTTPGGTRIIYDRNFLIQCRDSPLAKTPPTNLPDIPGVTRPIRGKQENGEESIKNHANAEKHLDDPQFHMDI